MTTTGAKDDCCANKSLSTGTSASLNYVLSVIGTVEGGAGCRDTSVINLHSAIVVDKVAALEYSQTTGE